VLAELSCLRSVSPSSWGLGGEGDIPLESVKLTVFRTLLSAKLLGSTSPLGSQKGVGVGAAVMGAMQAEMAETATTMVEPSGAMVRAWIAGGGKEECFRRRDGGLEADTRDGQRRREAVEDFVWREVFGGGGDGKHFQTASRRTYINIFTVGDERGPRCTAHGQRAAFSTAGRAGRRTTQ
jgi:hypothetical protein